MRNLNRISASAFALLLLAGCATTGPVPLYAPDGAGAGLETCARLFERVERAVAEFDVRDNQAEVVTGFPYLRVNRFLESFRPDVGAGGLQQWLELMASLDARARPHELANLPDTVLERPDAVVGSELSRCRGQFLDWDLAHPERIRRIRQHATVPDDYLTWRRVAGIYPVSGWFILQGVEDWHDEVKARFAGAPPAYTHAKLYVPPAQSALSAAAVAAILADAARNPLQIPLPDAAQRRVLARRFAPAISLPVTGDYDLIGVPVWTAEGSVTVAPEPVVYVLFSHTRLGAKSLLQITYTAWFAARPRNGPFDLLGGRLDGIVWRVTLGQNGKPLLYDSMHPCGCYHMAFPGPRLEPKPPRGGLHEGLLVPQPAPPGAARITLYLEPRTHYLVGLSRAIPEGDAVSYSLKHYDTLRSMPDGFGGSRSLFGAFGIVPGTARRERWLFWPTGVRSPGAMRQWGRHVTAFVGKRHFDDPYLIQRYFYVNPPR